jgi:hypothetical protein
MQNKLKYSDILMVIKIIARLYIGLSSPLHKLLVTGFWVQHIHGDKNVVLSNHSAASTNSDKTSNRHLFA